MSTRKSERLGAEAGEIDAEDYLLNLESGVEPTASMTDPVLKHSADDAFTVESEEHDDLDREVFVAEYLRAFVEVVEEAKSGEGDEEDEEDDDDDDDDDEDDEEVIEND